MRATCSAALPLPPAPPHAVHAACLLRRLQALQVLPQRAVLALQRRHARVARLARQLSFRVVLEVQHARRGSVVLAAPHALLSGGGRGDRVSGT